MEKILSDFGVNPLLLAAQTANFLVLLFILKRFLYKPLLKVLEERKEKIEQSLKQAEEIQETLTKTEEEKEKKLAEATTEARGLIEEATKNANQIIAQAHTKASKDIEEMLKKGQEQIKQERLQMQQELRGELGDIVALAMEKVTGKVLTEKDQKELIAKTVKDL
jgi:F-type H+-transporting ATPase subunit b